MPRLTSTLKAFALSAAIAIGMLASSQIAAAQSQNESFRIHIPFEFRAGKAALPAGEYTVLRVNQSTYVIHAVNGQASAALISHAAEVAQPKQASSMVFHRYGDTYFVSQIWRSGDNIGAELPRSRGEREVMQASLDHAPALVELAMK